ncbi:MAG: PHB depolymerase family esterase [Bacteroidota bacterium]
MRLVTIILFVFFWTVACQSPEDDQAAQTITYEGLERKYLLYQPKGLAEGAPLVYVLHGYGDSAPGIRDFTQMDQIADQYQFAVCYPEASMGPDSLRSWNVGYSNYERDDIGFFKTLHQKLLSKYGFSSENVFCTGMSNGGDMTIQMALLAPGLFKAIAPDVGCLMNWLHDSTQVDFIPPALFINGTADSITLYAGEEDYPAIGPNGYKGTREMIEIFTTKNQCRTLAIDTLPDINSADSSFVVLESYSNCKEDTQIQFYQLVGGGHDWPGAFGNMDFVASEVIWQFFAQYVD